VIADKLGATQVPTTSRDVEQYLGDMRPALRVDHRTRTVARALLFQPAPSLALRPFSRLVMNAGISLLPPWAARMHNLDSRWPVVANDAAVRAVRDLTNWALRR
jgi:uncharacterized protein (DUF2236 family)